MSVVFATLAQEVNGKVQYIYPKTDASSVEYSTSQTVTQKIDELNTNITNVDQRVTDIVNNLQDNSLFENKEELLNMRVPNYNIVPEGTTYSTAGDAIRDQFEELYSLINSIKKQLDEIQNK